MTKGGAAARVAATSSSGLCGARFVANTGPMTSASIVGRWTNGWSGSSTVIDPSSAVAPASPGTSYAR